MEFDFGKKPGQILRKKCRTDIIRPKVSIITPYYNSGKYFEETYHCVLNQTFDNWEWIIVDDGSAEEETQILNRLAQTDSRIRVFRQENGGQSKAKNRGIRESCAETIVFLDADDLIEDFYVEYLYRALEEYPDAGWSYMDVVGFGSREYVWCKKFSAGRMTFNNFLVNSAAFRKRRIVNAGCFPEIAKHYDEDWALYLNLMKNGVYPVHIPVIGFWYRNSQSGISRTVRQNSELKAVSDQYIQKLAKDVNICLREEIYGKELPAEAVASEYSKSDAVVAWLCRSRPLLWCVNKIYSGLKGAKN